MSVAEVSSLLRFNAMSSGEYFFTFRRISLPSSTGKQHKNNFSNLKKETIKSFETSETTRKMTQHHIPHDCSVRYLSRSLDNHILLLLKKETQLDSLYSTELQGGISDKWGDKWIP
jgi:hypothetical protein